MAIRDINIEYQEDFDGVPSYFSQKHGQLVVRGLGKWDPADDTEPIADYKPFIPELNQALAPLQLKVTVSSFPENSSVHFYSEEVRKIFPLGGVSFKKEDFITEPYWVYFEEQLLTAPGPGFTDWVAYPAPGVSMVVQQYIPPPPA